MLLTYLNDNEKNLNGNYLSDNSTPFKPMGIKFLKKNAQKDFDF